MAHNYYANNMIFCQHLEFLLVHLDMPEANFQYLSK